jgi:PAS domain S-box-containing protein
VQVNFAVFAVFSCFPVRSLVRFGLRQRTSGDCVKTQASFSKGQPPTRLAAFPERSSARTRILLVNDNSAFLELYSQILREAGYEVLTARRGRQGLRMVRDRRPGLVVLDVVLPDLNGLEVCRRIKADPTLRDIFVILISGQARSAKQTQEGLAIGADEYLSKPAGAGEFLARIRSMVRLHETTVALRASEQHHRRLVEILPDAIALIDPQLRLAAVNQRAVAMLGYGGTGELLGRSVLELIQPKDRDRFRMDITGLKPGAIGSAEYVFLARDGRGIPVELSAAVSTAPDGAGMGFVLGARDITERRRLEEDLRQLPRRITEAQEAERLRVAQELHDGVNQVIASATMRLRRVQDILSTQSPAAKEILSRCHKLLVQALEENRRIARNLRPNDLDELGLRAACRNLCKELQARTNLAVKCRIGRFDRPLPPRVDLGLFRIVQEALNNVEKHAAAKNVRVQIAVRRETIVLKVQDDGRGFDSGAAKAGNTARRGIGLSNLRERAAALGGMCDVVSTPKKGTSIGVIVPLPKSRQAEAGRSRRDSGFARARPANREAG